MTPKMRPFRFELQSEPVTVELMGKASVTLRSVGDGRLVMLDAEDTRGWLVKSLKINGSEQLAGPVPLALLGEGNILHFDPLDIDSNIEVLVSNRLAQSRQIALRAKVEDRFFILRGALVIVEPAELTTYICHVGFASKPYQVWPTVTDGLELVSFMVNGQEHRKDLPFKQFCREGLQYLGSLGPDSSLAFLVRNTSPEPKNLELRLVVEV